MTTTPIPDGDALRRACRDLGLGDAVADALLARLLHPSPGVDPQDVERMARREAEMMQLLKTPTPDKLIHDLRNLLNEVALLKAAADL
jgi:hypothetical protein